MVSVWFWKVNGLEGAEGVKETTVDESEGKGKG